MFKKTIQILIIALTGILMSSHSAFCASFPEKPIKIIVPFNAGGETDISARLLAAEMEKIFDEKVVVQNIAGASGMIGCKAMLSARPDGYTLGVIPSGPLAMHPHMRKIPYTIDDFAYIGRIINSPYLVFTDKNSPWNNIAAMVSDMKAKPNDYYWASSGAGSVPFFAMKEFAAAFGVKVRHVPFNDDTGAFQAIAGKRAHVYTTTAGALTKFDVKALALLDKERSPLLSDLPSISESGKDVFYSQWMVLVATKNVPKNILNIISSAMEKASQSSSFVEKLRRLSLAPGYLPPEETTRFVKEESDKNGKNIRSLMEKKN